MTMMPNYRPWDGLINRLRACDEHVAQLQQEPIDHDSQPDEAWGSYKTDEDEDND